MVGLLHAHHDVSLSKLDNPYQTTNVTLNVSRQIMTIAPKRLSSPIANTLISTINYKYVDVRTVRLSKLKIINSLSQKLHGLQKQQKQQGAVTRIPNRTGCLIPSANVYTAQPDWLKTATKVCHQTNYWPRP